MRKKVSGLEWVASRLIIHNSLTTLSKPEPPFLSPYLSIVSSSQSLTSTLIHQWIGPQPLIFPRIIVFPNRTCHVYCCCQPHRCRCWTHFAILSNNGIVTHQQGQTYCRPGGGGGNTKKSSTNSHTKIIIINKLKTTK